MLLGIIDEATTNLDFSDRFYRLPPNFMDLLQKEPANMQRILLML